MKERVKETHCCGGGGVWKMREGRGIRINIKWNCKGGESGKLIEMEERKGRAGDNVKCI